MFARKGPAGLPDEVDMTCIATWMNGETPGDDLSDAQILGLLEQAKMSILQNIPYVQPEAKEKALIEVVPAPIARRLNGRTH